MSTAMMSPRLILALVLALPSVVRAAQYSLVKEYAGTNFFNDWDFYGNCEWLTTFISLLDSPPLKRINVVDNLTNGDAMYVRRKARPSPPSPPLFRRPSARSRLTIHTPLSRVEQLCDSIAGRVRTARVRQPGGKRGHEGRQYDRGFVQREAQHGAHLDQGSVCGRQRVDRGHAPRPVRGKSRIRLTLG